MFFSGEIVLKKAKNWNLFSKIILFLVCFEVKNHFFRKILNLFFWKKSLENLVVVEV